MNLIYELWLKLDQFFSDEESVNQSVEGVILDENIKRISRLLFLGIIINAVAILAIVCFFHPSSALEIKWSFETVMVHGASMIIIGIISLVFLIKKEKTSFTKRLIQNLFVFYVVVFGFAIIFVDLQRAPNIVPYICLCLVLGVFVSKRPIDVICQYFIVFTLFYYLIGTNVNDLMALMFNRLNGLAFTIISIFLSVALWKKERNSVLQKRKIEEQQKKLQLSAYLDELTGLFNRKKWIELLDEEIEKIKRYNHQSSIMILDVDNFNSLKDQYGKAVGDVILREIAELLSCNLRKCDKIGRWGGEKFIVLLTETPVSNGIKVGEKLRNRIESACIQVDSYQIKVTLSVGVSILDCEHDFSTSYQNADHALDLAKLNGRNRVEYYSNLI
jgi:diguanylate cyclase (GGDEF)-like protein